MSSSGRKKRPSWLKTEGGEIIGGYEFHESAMRFVFINDGLAAARIGMSGETAKEFVYFEGRGS